jgi:hypothetical protein
MSVHRHLSALGLGALLSACAGASGYGPESPHYAYPADLRISLLKPLEIPPASATVRLQYGHPVARNGVQETDPHCIFELETVSDGPQQVRPDQFQVTRFQRRIEAHSGMPVMQFHAMRTGFGQDDGPSQIYYVSEFRLRSASQPTVRALTCLSNQQAPGIAIPRHLALAEIRQALGAYFSLELPGSGY